jgi:hypothetical protein
LGTNDALARSAEEQSPGTRRGPTTADTRYQDGV